MCHRGELSFFRTGRMIRITAKAVEEHECQKSVSDDCAVDSASTGQDRTASGSVAVLRHAPERKRRQRP
ncbi:hypothetical protein [Pseudooceanicola spongiae]